MLRRNGHGHGLGDDAAARRLQSQRALSQLAGQPVPSPQFTEAGLVPSFEPHIYDPVQQRSILASGLIEVFVKTCQRWRLSEEEQMTLLGYPDAPVFFKHLKSGHAPLLSQDTKDRVGYILDISLGLGALYNESQEAELSWLQKRRRQFEGRSAMEYMLRGKLIHLITVVEAVLEERNPSFG